MNLRCIEGPVTELGTPSLQGVITVKQLVDVYNVDTRDYDSGEIGIDGGYQRDAEEARIKALANKIKLGYRVVNSVLLNNREGKKTQIDPDKFGIVDVEMPKALWAVDGQHRCRSWIRLYERAEELGLLKDDVAEMKLNITMLWGADKTEEVNVFYDVNHFAKNIAINNRLELDVYLTKTSKSHQGDTTLVKRHELVTQLSSTEIWDGIIKFPNQKIGIVPSNALISVMVLIFKNPALALLDDEKNEKFKLIDTFWNAIAEVYPEILGPKSIKKDWSMQKAIGVNVLHRLIPHIYADILNKNLKLSPSQHKDVFDKETWKYYFKNLRKNHRDFSVSDVEVDAVGFWKTGKEGAAGQYSSGQGRNTLIQKLLSHMGIQIDE